MKKQEEEQEVHFGLINITAGKKQIRKMHNLRNVFIFCISAMLTFPGSAQSVILRPNHITYDDVTILMNAQYGQWADYNYVTFYNSSYQDIRITAHIHHHLQFIYFVDDQNMASHEINITLPVNSTYRLKVTSKMQNGDPLVYNDLMGFDVTYGRGGTAYFEINVSAYFYNSLVTSNSRPDDYEFLGLNNVPRRIPNEYLPIKVYSNHLQMGVDNDWTQIIKKAIDTWNNAASTVELTNTLFEYTINYSQAGLFIDWSGSGLPYNALGVAKLSNSNPTYIMGITMRPPGSDHFGRTAEVLIQEMGHILGIGHSHYQDDLMNGTAHGHIHTDLAQVELTTRDRQMLRWLYNRQNCIDILPQR